jgi:hypothetical protein
MRRVIIWRAVAALTLGSLRTPAAGQTPVPVVFLPGLNEYSALWSNAGSAAAASFNIAPFYPSLTKDAVFNTQLAQLGAVDTTSVLVGHSAGGLLARYRAQSQKVAGVVTYGTPNYGAPLEETWTTFCGVLAMDVADGIFAVRSLWAPGDDWVMNELNPDWDFAFANLDLLCGDIIQAGNFEGAPAGFQLAPDAGFLNDTLDLASNVSTEIANAGVEASVVFVTDNFYDVGAFKLANPNGTGEAIGHIVQYVGAAAAAMALYIDLNYPDDQHYLDVATNLDIVADDIAFLDEAWCESVSGTLLVCWDNDETVPVWSQALGRGTQIVFNQGGVPAHTLEVQYGANFLPSILSSLGIPTR